MRLLGVEKVSDLGMHHVSFPCTPYPTNVTTQTNTSIVERELYNTANVNSDRLAILREKL